MRMRMTLELRTRMRMRMRFWAHTNCHLLTTTCHLQTVRIFWAAIFKYLLSSNSLDRDFDQEMKSKKTINWGAFGSLPLWHRVNRWNLPTKKMSFKSFSLHNLIKSSKWHRLYEMCYRVGPQHYDIWLKSPLNPTSGKKAMRNNSLIFCFFTFNFIHMTRLWLVDQ